MTTKAQTVEAVKAGTDTLREENQALQKAIEAMRKENDHLIHLKDKIRTTLTLAPTLMASSTAATQYASSPPKHAHRSQSRGIKQPHRESSVIQNEGTSFFQTLKDWLQPAELAQFYTLMKKLQDQVLPLADVFKEVETLFGPRRKALFNKFKQLIH